ncbi:AAA family ATPase [Paenibacillus sp. KR2-11]|uniref:AAA family ATPase n=1 Tax=Paenibacillus sp. KR2-11 TaxID=3385500 RepID=UPI0038FCCF10
MRPLKLIMTAFGPYKDQEVIDFSELRENRLFVVSGNTGAGKTSIFDAICFALYGDASGEDRNDSRMLRSHFADDQVHTSVDFVFELKGRTYRVFRQLSHVKAGNKGATGERYELYAVDGGAEVPLTDRFIVSQVDEKIRGIIGLTKEQFSQIVMLPQGEFRKLLTSETENKEEILRRIFKTGLYKYVADHLNEKRKQMQQSLVELTGLRDYHIATVKGSLSGREGSALTHVLQQQHYNTYQVLEALEQEIGYYAEQILEKRQLLESETLRYQEMTAVYHQAQNVNEQFELLDRRRADRQGLLDQAQEIERITRELSLAEQAVHLQVYERHDAQMREELARKSKQLEAALSECRLAEEALQRAAGQYELEEGKEGAREQALRELDRLQGLLPTVREMDRKDQLVRRLAEEAAGASKQWKEMEAALEARQSERTALAAQVKALEERVVHLPQKTERLALLRQQAQLIKEYLGLLQKSGEEQAEEARGLEVYGQAERAHRLLEDRWIEGQAGWLASHLHDGDACPVCGSADHPKKAAATGDIPTREELERLRAERSAAEKTYLEAKAKLAATGERIREKEQQVLEQGIRLEGIREAFAGLVQEGKALAEEEKRLKDESASLAALKEKLEKLEYQLEELRGHKEAAAAVYHDGQTLYATEKALYEQTLAALPEELRGLEALERRIRAADAAKKQLEAEWKQAQHLYREANERSIKAVAARSGAESQQREAEDQARQAGRDFAQALEAAGFGSEAAYQEAKRTDAARAELKGRIETYHAALAVVTRQIEDLAVEVAGKERQDLGALQQQLQEMEQSMDAIRRSCTQAESHCEKGKEGKANIAGAEANVQQAEREYQLVKDLYDVVRGENVKKVSFERYLQIEFLEKIIHTANQRLQRITGGQFYLVRSDRMEKRGKQSGLGFDVYDNYTGQLRDVKTLSGGEKFNASLCLALGMADVIQAYEGGISLETMFIDEGFGSLDEESLNKAIDTLIDLQQSGRMIGVISHVQELKQAIPAVLEVKKTREGYSYTRFSVR